MMFVSCTLRFILWLLRMWLEPRTVICKPSVCNYRNFYWKPKLHVRLVKSTEKTPGFRCIGSKVTQILFCGLHIILNLVLCIYVKIFSASRILKCFCSRWTYETYVFFTLLYYYWCLCMLWYVQVVMDTFL